MIGVLDTSKHKERGNTKTLSSPNECRSRQWTATLNNHTDTECLAILTYLQKSKSTKFVIQEEVGEEEKTPHLQMTFKFANARKFSQLKKVMPRAHLEVCKSWEKSVAYCRKPSFDGAKRWEQSVAKALLDPLVGLKLKPYQIRIFKIIEDKPDQRKIHWFWEPKGRTGKSVLTKHLCMSRNALAVTGKASDIKYAVAEWIAKRGELDILLIDLPRTNEKYISYQAMEEIKNGLFFSTKYESGMTIFNPPHVIIFANFPPDRETLSEDRWDVEKIV